MILVEMGNYLEAQGIGTQAVNLFIGELPETDQDPVSVIYEYPGAPIERTHDHKIDMPRLQFQTRSLDYTTGRQKLVDIYNVVEPIINQLIGGVLYYRVEPIQSPSFLSRDENNRIMFVFNAQVMKEFS